MRNQRGQSTLEIAVLMAVVIGALLAMQMYMRRGTQGKLREMSDQIGEQFEPTKAEYTYTAKGYIGDRVESSEADGSSSVDFKETRGSFREGSEKPVGRNLADEKLFK